MTSQEELDKAIAHLEAQRAIMGDAAVDAAIEGLRRKFCNVGASRNPIKSLTSLNYSIFQDRLRIEYTFFVYNIR